MARPVRRGVCLAAAVLATWGCMSSTGDVIRPDATPPGGWWDEAGWRQFLDGWSREVLVALAEVDPAQLTPAERAVVARGTLAEPGANRYPSFQALMMAERPRVLAALRDANAGRRR